MMRIAVQIPTRTSQLDDLGMLFLLSSSQKKAKSKDHSPHGQAGAVWSYLRLKLRSLQRRSNPDQ
jgi:hypothetical protein